MHHWTFPTKGDYTEEFAIQLEDKGLMYTINSLYWFNFRTTSKGVIKCFEELNLKWYIRVKSIGAISSGVHCVANVIYVDWIGINGGGESQFFGIFTITFLEMTQTICKNLAMLCVVSMLQNFHEVSICPDMM